jgi:zinc protease
VTAVHRSLSVAAAVVLATATAGAQALPKPEVAPERPFAPPPRVERTLSNGLRVVAVRYGSVPKLSAILTVKAGLAVDPPAKSGLAQIVAEAAQEGTTTRSSEQLKREVFALGATLSGAAGQDSTSLQMRGLSETLPRMLALLADVVRNPTFPQAELDLITANTAQQLQAQLASPQYVANKTFRQALFGEHPYARIGVTPESLPAIDRASLVEFHKTYYRPNHAFLVVVGDATPEAVFAAAEQAFGSWPRGAVPAATPSALPALKGRRLVFVQRPNSVQSSISVGNFSIKRDDERWYTLQLANQIYGAAFDSRLVRNIREEKGYTYSPQSVLTGFADAGFYRFAADVRNEVTGATLTEVFKEIDKLRAEGSDGTELQGAKQYLRGIFPIQTSSQTGLAATLNNVYVFGLPKDYPETFRAKIAGVTPAQVKSAAAAVLGSEHSVIAIVGDWEKVKDQLAGYKDITFLDADGKVVTEPQ